MSDVRLELRFKNAELWRATVGLHGSLRAFCEKNGVMGNYSMACSLLSLRFNPWRTIVRYSDEFVPVSVLEPCPFAVRLAQIIGLSTEALFPIDLYAKGLTDMVAEVPLLALPAGEATPLLGAPDDFEGYEGFLKLYGPMLAPALAMLPERDRRAIELRYGLEDGVERNFEQIGCEFQVTRERARQLLTRAEGDLRRTLTSMAPKKRRKWRRKVAPCV